MEKSILDYIKDNKKDMGKDDFDTFFESDKYNDLDDDSKRIIFYMTTFIMSVKDYKTFSNVIDDFIKITLTIKRNEYLKNTHECYEEIICNYLKKIKSLLDKGDLYEKESQNEFIKSLNNFVDELNDIYYPNNKMKSNTIKYWKKIENELDSLKEEISKENIKKFERYKKNLNKYINSLEIDENNYNQNNNNQSLMKNIFLNNNIINNDNINNNNNSKEILNDNQYKIINNNENNYNSLYNSKIYYDSIMVMNPSASNNLNINNNQIKNMQIDEDEDETEEEEKLQEKFEQVDNFIDYEIIPKYFNSKNNTQEEINNLKEQLAKKEQNEDNNKSVKSSISSTHKKKKKKSKKNKNSQNQNLNNNPVPNYMPNVNFPYVIVPQVYIPFNNQIPVNMIDINQHNFIPNNNNFGNNINFQNQFRQLLINNNQNQNYMINKNNNMNK